MYISLGIENEALNNQGNNCNSIRGVKWKNKLVSLVVTGKLNAAVGWCTNIQKAHAEFLFVSGERGMCQRYITKLSKFQPSAFDRPFEDIHRTN
jgi:hypothetical protein